MMIKKENGFTLIEMIFCISVILVILLLVIPEVTSKIVLLKRKAVTLKLKLSTLKLCYTRLSMENYQQACHN